jgi:hypothetical protein
MLVSQARVQLLATEVAECVKDVTEERGLDTENERHLGEAPNPHQLLVDRRLAMRERMKLQERDIILPTQCAFSRIRTQLGRASSGDTASWGCKQRMCTLPRRPLTMHALLPGPCKRQAQCCTCRRCRLGESCLCASAARGCRQRT